MQTSFRDLVGSTTTHAAPTLACTDQEELSRELQRLVPHFEIAPFCQPEAREASAQSPSMSCNNVCYGISDGDESAEGLGASDARGTQTCFVWACLEASEARA